MSISGSTAKFGYVRGVKAGSGPRCAGGVAHRGLEPALAVPDHLEDQVAHRHEAVDAAARR